MTWLWRTEASAAGGPVVLEHLPGLLSWDEDANELIRAITVAFLSRMAKAVGTAGAEIARSDHPRAPDIPARRSCTPYWTDYRTTCSSGC